MSSEVESEQTREQKEGFDLVEAAEGKLNRNARPRYKNPDTVEDAFKQYPAHLVKLVNLVKSNSDIRRYTSLGILNYLWQKGLINSKNGYVKFTWSKFTVNSNGSRVDYSYTESFFLNCLNASFTSFANAAKKIVKAFCYKELEEGFVEDESVTEDAVEYNENADTAAEASE